MKTLMLLITVILLTTACKVTQPRTIGDPLNAVNYGYQPIDPLPIDLRDILDSTFDRKKLLDPLNYHNQVLNLMSDDIIRMAIGEVTGSGSVSYGPAKIGYAGRSYEIIIDYMKFQTQSQLFYYTQKGDTVDKLFNLNEPHGNATLGSVPIYLGVGLRLKATITVQQGEVNLGNIFGVGLAAEAKRVTGSLVVQTLGITGEKITSLIPMPSEISTTSLQNAVMALGTIKSKIYDADTKITPRVLGFYNSFTGNKYFVNAFINNLLQGNPIMRISTEATH